MTPVEALNQELIRLHESYRKALLIEAQGIRLNGPGYQVETLKQIQFVTDALIHLAKSEKLKQTP